MYMQYFEYKFAFFMLLSNLAGIHPSLQVASTDHRNIQDIPINSILRTLSLVDK